MKKYYYFIYLLIFLLALYLRFNLYFFDCPLWHDECSLAINLLHKNYLGFFGVLEHQQSAPPLFMIFTKFLSNIFGIKEFVVRFIPLCASILSLPAFFLFSKSILKKDFSVLFANFLFCINYYVIYYAQEFKQYSTDILLFLITFIIVPKIDFKDLSIKKTFAISIIFSLIILFSLPPLFVIGAFIVIEFLKNRVKILNKLILFSLPIFITFITLYFTSLMPSKSPFLMSYWENGFITFNILQILSMIKTNILYYFYPNKFVLFIFSLIIIGLYSVIKSYKERSNALILSIIVLILTASVLRLYPILERVSLYIIPILIVLLSKSIDLISKNRKIFSMVIIFLLIFSINLYNFNYVNGIRNNLFRSFDYDARSTMEKLKEMYNNKDLIAVNVASDSEFIYYSKFYDLPVNNYVIVQTPNKSQDYYFHILDSLPKGEDVWFYYVYDYSHSPVIPFLNEWSKGKTVLYKYANKNSLIMRVKL